jgi:glyoxylase-like metal-dependent hydrolase (beta-lactamase superfamily II)
MLIKIEVGMIGTNCYIFSDDDTNEGIIIDPGDNAKEIMRAVNENNIKAKYIILTHGHWDHIGDARKVKELTGVPILMHSLDADCMNNSKKSMGYLFGKGAVKVDADQFLNDQDELALGNTKIKVIFTPGHTLGGICLKIDNILFSGDTLFAGTIGRTDLPGGNHDTLIESIKSKLMMLEDDTVVYPGHGWSTTIGQERGNFR